MVEVSQIALPGLLDDLIERGFSLEPMIVIKQYVRENITAFKFGPVRIDWLKPVLPFYSRALADANSLEWSDGHSIRVATAEGLILTKRPDPHQDGRLSSPRPDGHRDPDNRQPRHDRRAAHPRGMVAICGDRGGSYGLARGRHRQTGRPA